MSLLNFKMYLTKNIQDNTLQIKRPGNYTYMKFNNIIPSFAGQKDVFFLL